MVVADEKVVVVAAVVVVVVVAGGVLPGAPVVEIATVVEGLLFSTPFTKTLVSGYRVPPEQKEPPKSSKSIDQTIQPL